MPRDVTEVLVGPGFFYTAPATEAKPTNPTTAIAGNWVEAGYSEEGWSFGRDATFEDVLVAEVVDAIKVLKTAQTLSWSAELAQNTLESLQLAMGGGTITNSDPSAGYRTYRPPASDAADTYSLLFRADAPPGDGTKTQDWYAPEAVSVGAVDMGHSKAPQKQVIAVEFRLIKPAAGDIFERIEEL